MNTIQSFLGRIAPETTVGVLEEKHYTLYRFSKPITIGDGIIADHPLPATEEELEFAYAGGENPQLYDALRLLGKATLSNPEVQTSIFTTITSKHIAINLQRTPDLDRAIGQIVRGARPLARPRFEQLT